MPETLWQLDNVVLEPHIGSATHETRAAMSKLTLDQPDRALRGQAGPDAGALISSLRRSSAAALPGYAIIRACWPDAARARTRAARP
jgi:hypothetical protein